MPCFLAKVSTNMLLVLSAPVAAAWYYTALGDNTQYLLWALAAVYGMSFLYRGCVLAFTLKQSAPLAIVTRLVHKLVPSYSYTEHQFFRADCPPEEIAVQREQAFKALAEKWRKKWPKSYDTAQWCKKNFSDLRFAAGNRVFLPFGEVLGKYFEPCTVVDRTERMDLIDIDNQKLTDVSGSYGVNVLGYDAYKEFITKGWEDVQKLGCVLGPIHPFLMENITMLQQISGHKEVSFHMSGTEAVMCAVRLSRFNSGKKMIVQFGGAYHGWWDGVQTGPGNERWAEDVITLKDLDPLSLRVIKARGHEIAAVLVNPLQSFHPNTPPPSDLALASNTRTAGGHETGYRAWLAKLRKTCDDAGIILVFDEVYTGFRLAVGGAQEYFGCKADMVCYGKTLGGGMPIGVVCGPPHLMCRGDKSHPMRVAYVIGTFSGHPLVLATMNHFLKWVMRPETKKIYQDMHDKVEAWVISTNKIFEKENIPLRVASYVTVWTMLFQSAGRYHWMLQYYLRDEGINLSWVGTGRLNYSLDFNDADLEEVKEKMVRACRRMKEDGWWHPITDPKKIKISLVKEMVGAFIKNTFAGKTQEIKAA